MQDLNDRLLAVEKQLDRIEKGLQGNKDCLHHIAQKLDQSISLAAIQCGLDSIMIMLRSLRGDDWQGEERRRALKQVRK